MEETPSVQTEREFLKRGAAARAFILTISPLAVWLSRRLCPRRRCVALCTLVLEDGSMARVGHVPGGPLSGSPLDGDPMGGRWCRGLERRDVILV